MSLLSYFPFSSTLFPFFLLSCGLIVNKGKQEFASAKRVLLSAIKLHPNDSSLRQEFESVKEKEVKYKISEEGNLRGYLFYYNNYYYRFIV